MIPFIYNFIYKFHSDMVKVSQVTLERYFADFEQVFAHWVLAF